MKATNLEYLGFKQKTTTTIYFKDIIGKISGEYLFFTYCGKGLPIIDDEEQLKTLIKGLYND